MAVQFKFTGDNKDVQRALDEMEKKYQKLIDSTKKGTDETKKMAAAAKKVFEETRTPMERYNARMAELQKLAKAGASSIEDVGRAAKMARQELEQAQKGEGGMGGLAAMGLRAAAAYMSVGAAIAYVNSELKRKSELEKTAADKQTEMAKLEREALINLGRATPAERKEILGGIDRISETRGVSKSVLKAALPDVSSARAGLSNATMLQALDMAARVAPHDPQTMAILSGGLENTAQLTSSANMTENMGFQLAVGEDTAIKSLKGVNEYLIPAALSVKNTGGSAEDAAAAASTMTSLMFDSEGRRGKTGIEAFAQRLKDFYPEKDRYGPADAQGKSRIEARGTGLKTFDERLRRAQSSKEEGEKFLASSSFELGAIEPITSWLDPTSNAAKMYDTRRKKIKKGPGAVDIATEFISVLENDPLQQGAASERAGAAVTEDTLAKDVLSSYKGRVRKMYLDELSASGSGTMLAGLGFDLSPEDAASYAIGHLGRRKFQLEKERAFPPVWGDADALAKQATTRIEGIEKVIRVLEGIKANQRNRNPDLHAE